MTAPVLSRYVDGGPAVTGDQLNTFMQTCDNVGQLRNFIGVPGIEVSIRGITSPGDGGAGSFWWNPTFTGTDDGVTTIIPYGSAAGAWLRLYDAQSSALPVANIAALRALSGGASIPIVWVEGYYGLADGGEGMFVYSPTDTTSADNGGTIIIDAGNNRYYRETGGERYSIKWFGAVANCTAIGVGTDSTTFIQNCFTAALLAGQSVYIPSGSYRLTGNVSLTSTADTTLLNTRPSISGAGSRSSFLIWDNGAINGLTIQGTNAQSPWAEAGASLEGVTLYKGDGLGSGLSLEQLSHFACRDVICYQWNVGNTNTDVQESVWDNCLFLFNVAGFIAARNVFTQPNGLTFINCLFGANQSYGADIQNGAVANFHGGSIEGNGGVSGTSSTWWGIRLFYNNGAVIESNASASFFGVYLERNAGYGDIYLADSAVPTVLSVTGCTFNRGNPNGGAPNGTSCVYASVSSGVNTKVVLSGNGMGGLPRSGAGAYVPSALTPYITLTPGQPILLVESGNRYTDAVETPNWPQGDFFACISFAGTAGGGATAQKNIASFTRTGTGAYTIVFNYPATNTNFFLGVSSLQGIATAISAQSSTSISITTTTFSGTAADVNFMNLLIWN